ncbi:uncharacterized protein [Nothobranchius furzeri]|uniref:uncharacterized protein n=1 Tax=Nothobranchius furzeri TaxID=105023 RepID=UPI003904CDDD
MMKEPVKHEVKRDDGAERSHGGTWMDSDVSAPHDAAAASRKVQMSLILLGVVSGDLFYTIRAGDDVALSCENVIKVHRNCNTTFWSYIKLGGEAQELVGHGQLRMLVYTFAYCMKEDIDYILTLLFTSLLLPVSVHTHLSQQNDHKYKYNHVYFFSLHPSSVREQTEQNKVTFICSVSPYDKCRHEVKWLFKGNDVEKDHPDVKTSSPSSCSAAVTFHTSTYVYSSRFKLFKCEVETENKQQLFTFSSGPTGGKTDTTDSAGGSPPTPGPSCTAVWLRFLIGSVGLAALTAGVVVTSRRTRAKGRKTQTHSGMVCDDGADGAADYENIRTSSV